MQYELSIRQDNIQAYLDIEHDIQSKQNGLFTFILRMNNGKIVDYNVLEYVDVKSRYLRLTEITRTELTILHSADKGTGESAVWASDN